MLKSTLRELVHFEEFPSTTVVYAVYYNEFYAGEVILNKHSQYGDNSISVKFCLISNEFESLGIPLHIIEEMTKFAKYAIKSHFPDCKVFKDESV